MCTVADLRARDADGEPVLDIADVADMNERLIVQAENRKRADDAARSARAIRAARGLSGGRRGAFCGRPLARSWRMCATAAGRIGGLGDVVDAQPGSMRHRRPGFGSDAP